MQAIEKGQPKTRMPQKARRTISVLCKTMQASLTLVNHIKRLANDLADCHFYSSLHFFLSYTITLPNKKKRLFGSQKDCASHQCFASPYTLALLRLSFFHKIFRPTRQFTMKTRFSWSTHTCQQTFNALTSTVTTLVVDTNLLQLKLQDGFLMILKLRRSDLH